MVHKPQKGEELGFFETRDGRCCPECRGTKFRVASGPCEKPIGLDGYAIQCTNTECNWRGFHIQLVK